MNYRIFAANTTITYGFIDIVHVCSYSLYSGVLICMHDSDGYGPFWAFGMEQKEERHTRRTHLSVCDLAAAV